MAWILKANLKGTKGDAGDTLGPEAVAEAQAIAETTVETELSERALVTAGGVSPERYGDGMAFTSDTGVVIGGIHTDGRWEILKPEGMAATPNINVTGHSGSVGLPLVGDNGTEFGFIHDDGTVEFYKLAGGAGADATQAEAATKSSIATKVAVGDSLTDGFDTTNSTWPETWSYPYQLGLLDTVATIVNAGVGGQTSDEISIRMGSLILDCTVEGGSIPASGTVNVTISNVIGWRPERTWEFPGTLAGVPGKLTRTGTATTALTFTRTTTGTAVAAPGSTPFASDESGHAWDTMIIGMGRNDISYATPGAHASIADHVIQRTKDLVNFMAPKAKRFLLWGTINSTAEPAGSAGHTTVLQINQALATAYPNNWVDVRAWLVNDAIYEMGLTPTADDLTDIANDTVPSQLMDDTVHYKPSAAPYLAQHFYTELTRREWA